MHISKVLEEWADSQPMKGQMELPFCVEVNSEFTSDARPGADWGTWEDNTCSVS